MPVIYQFDNTGERDAFLDEHFPEREFSRLEPPWYALPGGDRLRVEELRVFYYAPEPMPEEVGA